jgi:SPP1 gp7 family putative phage head morphogenesis protein
VDRVAVAGPPWRLILEPRSLDEDPAEFVACTGWTAIAPSIGRLEAASCPEEAAARAVRLAAAGDGTSLIFKGKVQLRSGSWLYVRPQSIVQLGKARSPLNRRDFARIVDGVHRSLLRTARSSERKALERAARMLKREWIRLSPAASEERIAEVSRAIMGLARSSNMTAALTGRLADRAVKVAAESRKAARRSGVRALLNVQDTAAVRRIGRDNAFWVSNEYGRRAAAWAKDASPIIRAGLSSGLDSQTIGRELYEALSHRVRGRTEAYFRTVANVAMTRARSYGQVSGFRDGGIGAYEWSATMDEATCAVCVYMNGQIFSTYDTMGRFDRAATARTPEEAIAEQRFYGVRGDTIYVRGPDTPVARFSRDENGVPGNYQTITRTRSTDGVTAPPAHEGCRCTLMPVL